MVPPADGNWANYTPPTYRDSTTSIFDPTADRVRLAAHRTPDTGDRNQNIYTAQLAPGLVLSAPGNAKQLGTGSNGQLIQRQFAISCRKHDRADAILSAHHRCPANRRRGIFSSIRCFRPTISAD